MARSPPLLLHHRVLCLLLVGVHALGASFGVAEAVLAAAAAAVGAGAGFAVKCARDSGGITIEGVGLCGARGVRNMTVDVVGRGDARDVGYPTVAGGGDSAADTGNTTKGAGNLAVNGDCNTTVERVCNTTVNVVEHCGTYDRSPHPRGRAMFVTYGDAGWARSRNRLALEAGALTKPAENGGGGGPVFDGGVFAADRGWLSPAFAAAHAELLARPRGGGFWVWKPDVMLTVMRQHMAPGDVLMYADAGCTFVASPEPYLAWAAEHGLVVFRGKMALEQYTKGFTFAALGMNVSVWGEQGQLAAGIIIMQRRPWVEAFLEEWRDAMAVDPRVVDDTNTSSLVPDPAAFKVHRHDQSVLSLLAYKHGVFMAPYRSWPKERAHVIAATRRKV